VRDRHNLLSHFSVTRKKKYEKVLTFEKIDLYLVMKLEKNFESKKKKAGAINIEWEWIREPS